MAYNKPNRTGKRFRKKAYVVSTRKTYSRFVKKYPEHKGLGLTAFNSIIREFNNDIVQSVIDNRDGVALPERLGTLQIVAFPKPKRKIIDFGKSNELGELVTQGNWDTDNKLGKIVYQNKAYNHVTNGRLWSLTPSRPFKARMSKIFRKFWQRYLFVDNGLAFKIKKR